jgi:ribonuclease HI
MSSFYAVAIGHKSGVYINWDECKKNIDGFDNPIYKKFGTIEEATEFIDDFKNNLYVYTDGACINNGSDNAKAGIGVYFGKDHPNNISKELSNDNGKIKLTNNIAELVAIIEAINIIKTSSKPNKIIITDSEYAIKCATTYGNKLEKKGWKLKDKDVPNLDLVKKVYELTNKYEIQFKHILAHTGNKDRHSIGNYYADLLANKAINSNPIPKKPSNPRVYLKVPYAKKDEAKAKGARWDADKKSWYIFEDNPNKSYLISTFQ